MEGGRLKEAGMRHWESLLYVEITTTIEESPTEIPGCPWGCQTLLLVRYFWPLVYGTDPYMSTQGFGISRVVLLQYSCWEEYHAQVSDVDLKLTREFSFCCRIQDRGHGIPSGGGSLRDFLQWNYMPLHY